MPLPAMSSGKRLAKRSIVGTRVLAPSPSSRGIYEPALIQAVRAADDDPAVPGRYAVRLESSR